MKPPFIPELKCDHDTCNFDPINQSEHDIKTLEENEEFMPSDFNDKTHFWGWNFDRDSFDFHYNKDMTIKDDLILQKKMEEMSKLKDDEEMKKFIDNFKNKTEIEYGDVYDMTIETAETGVS